MVMKIVLTSAQRKCLIRLRDHHTLPYVREKASAILKLSDGMPVRVLARSGLLHPRARQTFHKVQSMTKALRSLIKEGLEVKDETLKRLSPYLTGHINRFGEYWMDMNRRPAPLDYHLPIIGR
jgi:hypothetical protein